MPKKSAKQSKNTKQFTVKSAGGETTTATIIVQNKIARTPLVSVILPGHNVSPFLDQCLSSVCNQTLQDIEIIYVDDGSTDNSLEIAKKFAEHDKRITVVSQENHNAGVARNAGLAIARGKYLSFLDSDDFFEPNMHETLYKRATETNADIVMCDTFLFDEQNQCDMNTPWTFDTNGLPPVFNYKDIPERIFKLTNCWVWNRLYRAEFIRDNKILFQSLSCCNDSYFSCIAQALARRIAFCPERLIHYRTNQVKNTSTTAVSTRTKHPVDLLRCFAEIYNQLNKLKLYKAVKHSYLLVATEHIYWSKLGMATNPSSLAEFKKFFAENFARIFADEFDFDSNTLNMKYSTLRNILIDAGVIKQIPKRIFYVWGAGEAKRPEVQKCIDTWKQFLPDYEIAELNEDNKEYFDYEHELKTNHWFKTVYSRKMWAYVADYIRIKALYEHGGIYFDTDVSVVKNMDKFLHNPAFVGMQSSSLDGCGDFVEPAICAAQRGNKFFGQIVRFYDSAIWTESVYTMPLVFDHFLREYKIFPFPIKSEQKIIKLPDLTIYPERYFIPFRYGEKFDKSCIEDSTHTVHWWGASWVKEENKKFLNHKHLLGYSDKYTSAPAVSVIVPVYNVATYLPKCLDSLINQTLQNIEIICVNDGSTDNSLDILKDYAARDNRIVVLDQPNQKLGPARNTGLRFARGEYVCFVDSDDWLDITTLDKLYNKIVSDKSELCLYGITTYHENTGQTEIMPARDMSIYRTRKNDVCTWRDIKHAVFTHFGAVYKLYKRSLLIDNNMFFPPAVCFEDVVYSIKCILLSKRISVLDENLYFYRVDVPTSIMSNAKAVDKTDDVICFITQAYDFLVSNNFYKELETEYLDFVVSQLNYHNGRISDEQIKLILQKKAVNLIRDKKLSLQHEKLNNLYQTYSENTKNIVLNTTSRLNLDVKALPVRVICDNLSLASKPCVSVIVCAYNAQDFLHKCLDSLLEQTLHNIEIICVNDGSSDSTLSVLQQYAAQDSRVRVIDQKNAGLSISRNNALKIARGEYIQFVDADDWLRADGLEYLYLYSKYYNLDMCCFGGINFDLATNQFVPNPYYQFEYLPERFKDIFNLSDCKDFAHRMAVSSCLTFYSKSFLDTNNIRWVNKKLCFEDNLFFTEALFKAKRISILKDKIYQRTIHSGCITRNIDKNFADYLEIADRVIQMISKLTTDKDIIKLYTNAYMGRCRSQFNGLNNKKAFAKRTAALLKKYNYSATLHVHRMPKRIKQYVLFPYYLCAYLYLCVIKKPYINMRHAIYARSYRGRTEMLNNNFAHIMNAISALNRRHDMLQKQLNDMRELIAGGTQQNAKLMSQLGIVSDNITAMGKQCSGEFAGKKHGRCYKKTDRR